jgi:hypothetical protein
MAEKAGVLSEEEVAEMEAELRVRVGEQRGRALGRLAAEREEWERRALEN